jgi:cytochrome c oxidase assembly factor CtaG
VPGIWSAGAWQVEPPLFAALVAVALYAAGGRKRVSTRPLRAAERWRPAAFYAGVAVVLLALDSPIDVWAGDLFAAHMTQHVLLLVVAPPLVVYSAPWNRLWRPLPLRLRRSVARAVALHPRARTLRLAGRALVHPVVATALFCGNLLAWHVPVLFDATLTTQAAHDLEHLLFLGTGILLWLQLLDSPPLRPRVPELWQAAIAGVAMLAGWVVAVVLAFAPSVLYDGYARVHDRPWHLDALGDQQIAAGIMWVPGSLPLTVAIVVLFYRWLGPEQGAVARRAAVGATGQP